MAPLKFEKVVSASSESPNYPATNLLKEDNFRKWLCSADTDGRAEVILQLSEASAVTRIDIGNAGSAFVEVQVGNADTDEDNYTTIIPASSFMTPRDSRNNNNTGLVKIYPREKLQGAAASKKWSRVKAICTQRFAKNVEFGLSFISLFGEGSNFSVFEKKEELAASTAAASCGEAASVASSSSTPDQKLNVHGRLQLGAFTLKAEDPSDDKRTQVVPKVTGASAVRNALKHGTPPPSTSSFTPPPAQKEEERKEKRKRDADSTPSDKPKKLPRRDRLPGESEDEDEERKDSSRKKKETEKKDSSKRKADERRKDEPKKRKERADDEPSVDPAAFSKLMSGVTFVLSGFEHPFRGELRDKATAMGAKYSQNWNDHCTHLVSAFKNTPKYKEVAGKGIIVKKAWIEECYDRKKLLPWERYSWPDLPKNYTKPKDDRSEEPGSSTKKNDEKKKKAREETPPKKRKDKGAEKDEKTPKHGKKEEKTPKREKKEATKPEKEEEKTPKAKKERISDSPSPSSARVSENGKKKKADDSGSEIDPDDDAYDQETDVEDNVEEEEDLVDTSDIPLPALPEIFKSRKFFFFGGFDDKQKKALNRYVISHGGVVSPYMGADVKYVVTNCQWSSDFDEALGENPDVVFVRPEWIIKCVDEGKLLPYQKFVVTE